MATSFCLPPSSVCRRPSLWYQEIPHFHKSHGRETFPPRSTTDGQLFLLFPLPSKLRTRATTLLAFGRGSVFPSGCTLPSPCTAILSSILFVSLKWLLQHVHSLLPKVTFRCNWNQSVVFQISDPHDLQTIHWPTLVFALLSHIWILK